MSSCLLMFSSAVSNLPLSSSNLVIISDISVLLPKGFVWVFLYLLCLDFLKTRNTVILFFLLILIFVSLMSYFDVLVFVLVTLALVFLLVCMSVTV